MSILRRVLRSIDVISEHSGRIFGFLVVPIFVIVGIEVVLRYGFNSPTIWAHELSQLIFGVYFVIAGAYTLLYNGHVRMDLLYRRLPPRKRAICDLITSILFFFLFVVVLLRVGTEHAWLATMRHQTTGSFWNAPIWPARWGLAVAAFLLGLQGVARFIRDLNLAITGRQSL